MATKESLQPREAGLKTLDDYTALAREALTEPADKGYAKEVLQKAEGHCQFPADYIKVAEAAVAAGDADYARELYEQAEEACFEGKEFAELGHSMAAVLGDKTKGAELLEKAAGEAKTMPEFLLLSKYAQEDIGDEALAKSMLSKVEEKAKSLEDYTKITQTIIQDTGDKALARNLYQKAARYCGDLPATITYAEGMKQFFGDDAATRKVLDDAETDCQFTKDFVALAGAYQRMFGDEAKVRELMQQAEEFAMTGEENVQLADGYWKLLHDKEAAAAAYQKSLNDITNGDQLLALAKTIAAELGDKDLAKKVYAKAESKMTRGAELAKLAQAVCDDLGDKEFASAIYQRAGDSLKGANDFVVLGGEVLKNLGDRDRAATLYRKALDASGDYASLTTLLNAAGPLENTDLTRAIVDKAMGAANTTPDYLQLTTQAATRLQDNALVGRLLDAAEERVTSVDEMRKVVAAAQQALPDDADRLARVQQKLEKREANQVRYAEFQKIENELRTVKETIALADRVTVELEDPFYAAKLLGRAEQALSEKPFHFQHYRPLVLAIDRDLDDTEWLKRLLDQCASQSHEFLWLRDVARTAARELKHRELGQECARRYLADFEAGLDDSGVYGLTKLATAVSDDLHDKNWAKGLLDKALQRAHGDALALAHIGYLYNQLGEHDVAQSTFMQAARASNCAADCGQLVDRLRAYRVPLSSIMQMYQGCGEKLTEPRQRLQWAEGIVDHFDDTEWAAREYAKLESAMSSETEKKQFEASRRFRLGRQWYGARRHGSAAHA